MIQWQRLAMVGSSISDTFIDFAIYNISKRTLIEFLQKSYSRNIYPYETAAAIKKLRKMPVKLARRKARRAMKNLYSF